LRRKKRNNRASRYGKGQMNGCVAFTDDINILIYSDNHRRRETIHDICLSWVKKTGSKILSRKI
jgi:hypothetical protein